MKSRFISNFLVLTLALLGVLSMSALAQTNEETPAPSDQPSAPMEIGQPGQGPVAPPQPGQAAPRGNPGDAQPTEAAARRTFGRGSGEDGPGRGAHQPDSRRRFDAARGFRRLVGGGVEPARHDRRQGFDRRQLRAPNCSSTLPTRFVWARTPRPTSRTLTHQDIQIQLGQGLANLYGFERQRSRA